mgnify:CR=1 FL=1
MKTIFSNRFFSSHQAFWLGIATFLTLWGLWLILPPAVVGGDRALLSGTKIASTPTHSGIFNVETKRLRDRMRGFGYDIANVPYAMYYDRGYAIHGASWHNRFGTPISHGCINLPVDTAKWLFEWTSVGTPVFIH